ncbi:Imm53 family immunity protein [Clostridium sp. HBUAS56017]|uniref:Imm53 family immunity protein n=1 Tax=Clostridium sp. HBUAS56017 TaxID=2571128 RepID=UPI00117775EA|nr:Imm53 family immunity protein [Clostridium sp. HBUAS56017]
MNMIKLLQDWYNRNCNGDWEHSYGVNIGTLDNPGWTVDIDLIGTSLENEKFNKVKKYINERN